jgi:hypothetical protein
MKNFLFILLCILPNLSYAKESCTFNWNISSKGIFVGQSSDRIDFKQDGIQVTSTFNPSSFLSLFGVNKLNRIVRFDTTNNMVFRSEEKFGEKNEKTIWNKISDNNWSKIYNEDKPENFIIDANQIIDSTTLPYLAQFNIIDIDKNRHNVRVLTKGKTYDAILFSEVVESKKEDQIKVFFKSENHYGEVILNKKKQPIKLFVKDKNNAFSGELKSNSCD